VIVATLSRTKPQAYLVARYQRENCCAWWEQEAYVPKPDPPIELRDLAIYTGAAGQPRRTWSASTLSRLYGIPISRARRNRSVLMRLSLMTPEARRYSVKVILQEETKCSKPSANSSNANTPTTPSRKPTGTLTKLRLPVWTAAKDFPTTLTGCR
jgi:hypothetical protein